MYVELKGIIIDRPDTVTRIRILVQKDRGDNYIWLVYPVGDPLNKGKIISFIGKQLHVSPGEIIWPEYIKIPKI